MCHTAQNALHTPQCVHNTALTLAYVSFRGMTDRDPAASYMVAKIPEMVRTQRLTGLDEFEAQFLEAPFGSLSERACVETSWLAEGMAVLGWSLGINALPEFAEKAEVSKIAAALGIFRPGVETKYLHAAMCDERQAIHRAKVYGHIYRRLREFEKGVEYLDFGAWLSDIPLRELSHAGVWLADGDLTIDGLLLHEVAHERLLEVHGIVHERYKAFCWLVGGQNTYTMVRASVN